ncbi:hypothetical protein MK489_21870 [Myxococcota bacterium]|nr:hypothetical protein [Myxococcota bacterium]
MSPSLHGRHNDSQDAFTDVLFNALLGFAFMFVVAFSLMNDPVESGMVDAKAEMLITVRWPDGHPDDVDAIVEDPRGKLVWYHNQDTGLMHLDRDDRGTVHDRIRIDGREIANPLNQETVSVRSLAPGQYVVNLLHYRANTRDSLPVTVKVEKLNPQVEVVYYGSHELSGAGQELTALRFELGESGQVLDVNRLPKSLLLKAVGKNR